jgi:hypothetical protein
MRKTEWDWPPQRSGVARIPRQLPGRSAPPRSIWASRRATRFANGFLRFAILLWMLPMMAAGGVIVAACLWLIVTVLSTP